MFFYNLVLIFMSSNIVRSYQLVKSKIITHCVTVVLYFLQVSRIPLFPKIKEGTHVIRERENEYMFF
jgi:hypothetical protein